MGCEKRLGGGERGNATIKGPQNIAKEQESNFLPPPLRSPLFPFSFSLLLGRAVLTSCQGKKNIDPLSHTEHIHSPKKLKPLFFLF